MHFSIMQIEIYKSSDRGTTKTNWLHSRHSFSFGNYLGRENFGALRVLNEDIIEPSSGFPMHHHDNMEIVTIVLEGFLKHKDTMGNQEIIKEGEIQRMSAGRGLYHSEMASDKRVHLLQIWVEPKEHDIKPNYEVKKAKTEKNMLTVVVSPVKNESTAYIHQDSIFLLGNLDKNISVTHNPKQEHSTYVFVISGKISIQNKILWKGDAAAITDTRTFTISALEDSKVLVIEVPTE